MKLPSLPNGKHLAGHRGGAGGGARGWREASLISARAGRGRANACVESGARSACAGMRVRVSCGPPAPVPAARTRAGAVAQALLV